MIDINIKDVYDKLGYTVNQIFGGMRCNSFIIEKDGKKRILQIYKDGAKYQAEKKYTIIKKILNCCDNKLFADTLAYGVCSDYSWLISEFKDGIMLNDARKISDFSLKNVNLKIAECLNDIHSTKVNKKYGWITDKDVFENNTFCDYLRGEISRFKTSVKDLMDSDDIDFMVEKANNVLNDLERCENQFVPTLCWYDINPNNLLIDKETHNLSGFIDAGGAKYGIKEWDIAFYKMEVCLNDDEYYDFLQKYRQYNDIDEEIINKLTVFIELDDMVIRVLDKTYIPKSYDTNFGNIIDKYNIRFGDKDIL